MLAARVRRPSWLCVMAVAPPMSATHVPVRSHAATDALGDAAAVREALAVPLGEAVAAALAVREAVAAALCGERVTPGVAAAPHTTANARFLVPAQGAPEKVASAASTAHAARPTHAALTTAADAAAGAAHAALAAKAQPGSEMMAGRPYEAKVTAVMTWPAGQAAVAAYDCCATPQATEAGGAAAAARLALADADGEGVVAAHAEPVSMVPAGHTQQ